MPKIVSLLSSATEIVCALGLRDQLIGRSHECDFPESVKTLPQLSKPKIDIHAKSSEIDRAVKALSHNALSIYEIDSQALKSLAPDFILTQDQCEVCAVSLKDVERAVCEMAGRPVKVISLKPNSLADVFSDILQIAEALDIRQNSEKLVRHLEQRMSDIAGKAHQISSRPRAALLEWIDPLMASGNWVPELVEAAGAENLFGEAGKHSPWLEWESLKAADPDVIVIVPCGFDLRRTKTELSPLFEKPGWADLKAVRENRVYLADGNQYFNRPGPRLVESLEILAEIFHPEFFNFGHQKNGWQQLDLSKPALLK